ncbi:MAG: hypothetical protein FH749_05655 [Firmicutes bacterium]|nr:hypothetical protein [Bacillota bacterium]
MTKKIVALIVLLTIMLQSGIVAAQGWVDLQHGQPRHTLRHWQEILAMELETPAWFPIHYDLVAPSPLLVLARPRKHYLDQEIDAIERYAANGGTVLIVNDWRHHLQGGSNFNALTAQFGARFNHDVLLTKDVYTVAGIIPKIYVTDDVYFTVQGMEADLSAVAPFHQGTIHLETEWDITGHLKGEIKRFAGLDHDRELPPAENVVFAARRYGKGSVILFTSSMDIRHETVSGLLRELTNWGLEAANSEHLADADRDMAFWELLRHQEQIESVYWTRPTATPALLLEKGWTEYIDGNYSQARQLVSQGEHALKSDNNRPPRPPAWVLWLLVLALIALGYFWREGRLGDGLLKLLPWLALGAGLLVSTLVVSNVAGIYQFWEFALHVLGLAILFAVFTLGIAWRSWAYKLAVLLVILNLAYLLQLPNHDVSDRLYLDEILVLPESAPVQLLAQEFQTDFENGKIADLPRHIENFVINYISYRSETVDLHMSPVETLRYAEEDCDGRAILHASILSNLGYDVQVAINNWHAWTLIGEQGYLYPESSPMYTYSEAGLRSFSIREFLFYSKSYFLLLYLGLWLVQWPERFVRGWPIDAFVFSSGFFACLTATSILAMVHESFYLLLIPLYAIGLRLLLAWNKLSSYQKFNITMTVIEQLPIV